MACATTLGRQLGLRPRLCSTASQLAPDAASTNSGCPAGACGRQYYLVVSLSLPGWLGRPACHLPSPCVQVNVERARLPQAGADLLQGVKLENAMERLSHKERKLRGALAAGRDMMRPARWPRCNLPSGGSSACSERSCAPALWAAWHPACADPLRSAPCSACSAGALLQRCTSPMWSMRPWSPAS